MKRLLIAATLILILSNCGGGGSNSSESHITLNYRGTLSGTGCFSMQPITSTVSYKIEVDSLTEGSDVKLTDDEGNIWSGSMTSGSSLVVTLPDSDERYSIALNNVTQNQADVEATTSCVSFRCCDTLNGKVTH